MAWRFDKQITRGEIHNTVRGRVTGRIWLAGVEQPLVLDLAGDCAPDLAGGTLTFENPTPEPFADAPPNLAQRGWVGDITASQKLRVHDVPMEAVLRLYRLRQPAPWHWANALYLEWFSESNGRVVIQTADFALTLSAPAWTLTPDEYRASREASGREQVAWLEQAFGPLTGEVRVVNLDELSAAPPPDDEGEEWKRADDDDDASEDDPMLVFDPIEDAVWMPARVLLGKYGFTPLRPAEVRDAHLRGRLWELIYALAGRRIFLHCTDHLDDRALYVWLDAFLDEDCADCPLAAETNYRVDVSDDGRGSDETVQLWMRYFSTEKERADWQRAEPGFPMPPREKPPHDRDRFLPEPPRPPHPWTPFDDETSDPPGADVDREIRREKLRDEIAEATGGEWDETKFADLPPAAEEAYLEQVRDMERDGWQRPIDELARQNSAPLPPDELSDDALTPHLWQLLHNLAGRGFYVQQTDHLSDRALYEVLWKKGLREEAILPGRSRTGGYFYDILGSYTEEDLEIHHRYYEDEKGRARHLAEYPNSTLPPRETPPFSRDWRRPKGPF